MKLLVLAALLLAPAARAEESFPSQVEDVMKTDWRKELLERLERERAANPELAPPVLSTAPLADEGWVKLRFSREDEDRRWREMATMTMTLKTFDRYRRVEQRFREDERLFNRELDPSRYYKFGGRDAAAIADVLFTSLAEDPFVRAHPWLEEPVSWVVEGMRLFDRIDRGSPWDIFGFEVDDWLGDRFGLGRSRSERAAERGYDRGFDGYRGEAGLALGMNGPIRGSPDGDFHGRLRFGVSGLERAATKFDADPIRVKVKYEIKCPRSFVLDKVEVGGEVRPFCRDENSDFRLYIGGGKNF
jgi:hypothetical protein